MPALNWDSFAGLPGSPERNFELLCRGIVRQNYGSFGVFRALANQPGVEFHLKLDKPCDALGEPGRWWGWQCKWYALAPNASLGAARRKKIEESLEKTELHLPGVTDWVLWTRSPLTKLDQDWFNSLTTTMRLHQLTGDDVDNLLAGQSSVLRSTYFGELVLTPAILAERHVQAVAAIRARWHPEVNQVSKVERELRRMLGEVDAWSRLIEVGTELLASAKMLGESPAVPDPLAPYVEGVLSTSRESAATLDRVATSIADGDLDLLRDELKASPTKLPVEVATAPRRLRAGMQRAGLYATNAVADCHDALRLLARVESGFSSRLVTVLAPAGCGKTHLAAQLTAETSERPAGVLLHGRDLHATKTLDDLARGVSIAAQPVPTMEALLAAVDAAGQRARKRLPIVIDGLNESEDPRTWKPLLAALEPTLAKYPYVVLVCTLRPEFLEDAVPEDAYRLEIKDYGESTGKAIHEHFRHWKIDGTDADFPAFLSHPLTLRLFCEVTNPTRKQLVGVSSMPGSLTTLFRRYLEQVGGRVVDLAPRTQRFYAQDVNAAIALIANRLWESRARSIEAGELRSMLGDAQRPWDQSLVRALEHEGSLLRMPSDGIDTYVPVYDLLGGYIIASALLAKHGESSFESWINDPATRTLLGGEYDHRHPLADDILASLVGQVPQRFYSKQVWQLVDEPLRGHALRLAADLEPAHLDAATVDALTELARAGDRQILARLWRVRGVQDHPLNAEGLDRALRPMSVAERDLHWTEWVRRQHDDLVVQGRSLSVDLQRLERRWRNGHLQRGDRLRARWVMWTLTSTDHRLRDRATSALYWHGRADAEGLFALAVDALAVNDAYVGERMLAAAYGVVTGHQLADAPFAAHLAPFLQQLTGALTGPSATAPTLHILSRRYVRGIVDFAAKFYPALMPSASSASWTFASPAPVQSLVDGDPAADEADEALDMDFMNQTLGRLVRDRYNHDMSHPGYKTAEAYVRGTVWALGWREKTFAELEGRLEQETYFHRRRGETRITRYGEKYGWIGFFSYAGILQVQAQFAHGFHDFPEVDIDPSFPEKPSSDGESSVPALWLDPSNESHEKWVCTSTTSLPASVLRRERIGEHLGPWVAVHGQLRAGDRVLGRLVWANVSMILVAEKDQRRLVAALQSGTRPWRVGNVPQDHYTFAGEMPWSPGFAADALAENAYWDEVDVDEQSIKVRTLAHAYSWEGRNSELNVAGRVRVPAQDFAAHFDLRSVGQHLDHVLPDGSRAAISLSGVDGLDGNILYVREDLVKQFAGEAAAVWLSYGERELRPYPSSQLQWLVDAQMQRKDAWQQVDPVAVSSAGGSGA